MKLSNVLYTSSMMLVEVLVTVKKAPEVEEDNLLHKNRSRFSGKLYPYQCLLTILLITPSPGYIVFDLIDQCQKTQKRSIDTSLDALSVKLVLRHWSNRMVKSWTWFDFLKVGILLVAGVSFECRNSRKNSKAFTLLSSYLHCCTFIQCKSTWILWTEISMMQSFVTLFWACYDIWLGNIQQLIKPYAPSEAKRFHFGFGDCNLEAMRGVCWQYILRYTFWKADENKFLSCWHLYTTISDKPDFDIWRGCKRYRCQGWSTWTTEDKIWKHFWTIFIRQTLQYVPNTLLCMEYIPSASKGWFWGAVFETFMSLCIVLSAEYKMQAGFTWYNWSLDSDSPYVSISSMDTLYEYNCYDCGMGLSCV